MDNADQYLANILRREAVDAGPNSPVRGVIRTLDPVLHHWGNDYLVSVSPSGSFAKGTANRSGTDIDLFVSLSPDTKEALREIYLSLQEAVGKAGYTPRAQNVSIGITVGGYQVDLVPGKRHDHYSEDHSLYRRRANTWTKTNVATHTTTVRAAGRLNETRILKLWRDQKRLDFPSFYLELTVIEALRTSFVGALSENVVTALRYLQDGFVNTRVVDVANTNNIISDDLTAGEKDAIATAAARALTGTWSDMVL